MNFAVSARLKFWGWGRESETLSAGELSALESAYARLFGVSGFEVERTPKAEDIELRAPRISPPPSLAGFVSADHYERLLHSYGRSFLASGKIL